MGADKFGSCRSFPRHAVSPAIEVKSPAHARTGDMDFGLSISRTYRPLGRFCLTLSLAQRVKVRAALSIECNGFPIDNSRADRQRRDGGSDAIEAGA